MKERDILPFIFSRLSEGVRVAGSAAERVTDKTTPLLKELWEREVLYRFWHRRLRYGN